MTPSASATEPATPGRALPVGESPVGATFDRLLAFSTVTAAIGFVVALSSIRPAGAGHGTHEQFGMTPCGWPVQFGIPCPTCGVTTAATHLVHLQPITAVLTQPFGAAFALAGLWLAWRALAALVRRESFIEPIVWWNWPRIGVISVVLLLASWGYKILVWPTS